MADGIVGAERVKLDQALHGYAEGHRELASSTKLKPRDAKTMLVLSDVSGPGTRIEESGYLTGYPLPDAGLYAVARTWAAPEMARPGCVWTHTLLIDFADLARLESLTDLLDAFRRPEPNRYADYEKALSLDCTAEAPCVGASEESKARQIMAALYSRPKARIIATGGGDSDEVLVTTLWSQQWPRLRRSFRFCTLAGADRSTEAAAFDLQMLPPGNQALRTRFSKAVDADNVVASAGWLDSAVTDLVQPRPDGLRSFLRRIGGDVDGGRAAFAPLCRLHQLIERFRAEPDAVTEAIGLLQDELGSAQARAARAIVASAAAAAADSLDDSGLDYLLAHLDLIEPARLRARDVALGRTILHRRPGAFASLIGRDGPIGAMATHTIASAAPAELTMGIHAAPSLGGPVLKERPELAAEPALWSRELGVDEAAFDILRRGLTDRTAIVGAMMKAGRTDLTRHAIAETGPLEVLRAADTVSRAECLPQDLDEWLRAAAHPSTVAELLARPEPLSRAMLALIARSIAPDDTPNDYGEDPWLSAMRRAEGGLSGPAETFLRAFLLARGLGWRSRNSAELVQFGFEHTYIAAAQGHLSESSWRWLDHRLPWSMLWLEWDRCQRLRAGVANLFVERELSPRIFGNLGKDGSLFAALAEQAARTSKGRSYLKHVRRALKESSDPSASARLTFLERLIK